MISYHEWVQNGLGVWNESCWDGMAMDVGNAIGRFHDLERADGALLCWIRLRGAATHPEWMAIVEWESTRDDDPGYVFHLQGSAELPDGPPQQQWDQLVLEISNHIIWELDRPEYVR